jgi:hypothetical protein
MAGGSKRFAPTGDKLAEWTRPAAVQTLVNAESAGRQPAGGPVSAAASFMLGPGVFSLLDGGELRQ